jgi:hypothetical protein
MTCLSCGSETSNPKFCSRSCAVSYNNKAQPKRKPEGKCRLCSKPTPKALKYCEECRAGKSGTGKVCPMCQTTFVGYNKYCSKVCLTRLESLTSSARQSSNYLNYIADWEAGKVSGTKGTGGVSNYVKRYLFEKFNGKCCKCGWKEINPTTKHTPLEVHHCDGDWKNSSEENLQLLCPNCHAITPTYKALNKGRGRPQNGRKAEVSIPTP